MEPVSTISQTPLSSDEYKYPVFLDGRLVGYLAEETVHKSTSYLRTLKIKGDEVPISTEIVVIPKKQVLAYQYIFLDRFGPVHELFLDRKVQEKNILYIIHFFGGCSIVKCRFVVRPMSNSGHIWLI
jgi:hypothetical protein